MSAHDKAQPHELAGAPINPYEAILSDGQVVQLERLKQFILKPLLDSRSQVDPSVATSAREWRGKTNTYTGEVDNALGNGRVVVTGPEGPRTHLSFRTDPELGLTQATIVSSTDTFTDAAPKVVGTEWNEKDPLLPSGHSEHLVWEHNGVTQAAEITNLERLVNAEGVPQPLRAKALEAGAEFVRKTLDDILADNPGITNPKPRRIARALRILRRD